MTEEAAKSAADAARKRRAGGRPFQPGQSGNPAGKAKGARSLRYAALDDAAEEALPEIVQALTVAAKAGDARAADLLFRRSWPERKGRPVMFALPVIETPDDLSKALGAILAGVAAGELTPEEGTSIANLCDTHRTAVFMKENEARMQAIETALGIKGGAGR